MFWDHQRHEWKGEKTNADAELVTWFVPSERSMRLSFMMSFAHARRSRSINGLINFGDAAAFTYFSAVRLCPSKFASFFLCVHVVHPLVIVIIKYDEILLHTTFVHERQRFIQSIQQQLHKRIYLFEWIQLLNWSSSQSLCRDRSKCIHTKS